MFVFSEIQCNILLLKMGRFCISHSMTARIFKEVELQLLKWSEWDFACIFTDLNVPSEHIYKSPSNDDVTVVF